MKTVETVKTVKTVMGAMVVFAFGAANLVAQTDVRGRLEARGLPADLVQQVVAIAAEATAQGLPADPLADKAIEGFAKQVPAARIVSAVRQFGARMSDGRLAVRDAGVGSPGGELITAAAEAIGRGLEPAQIGRLVRAAPQPALAAPGLTVAAALAAQGMAGARAVDVVTATMQNGGTAAQILDLPSVARAMQSRGMSPDEAGRRMLRGGPPDGARPDGPLGPPGPGQRGIDGRPPGPGTGMPGPRPPGARPGGGGPPGGGRPPVP